MVVLLKVIQVILALSLLVAVHEFGHFIFARIFKVRVERFYLFFNPKFSLVKVKRFGGRLHWRFFAGNQNPEEWQEHPEATEFGIGWVPFGGYCAISGMVDETTKSSDLPAQPQPWEFRTKKAWQRFFIMFGGVLFNFILAFGLYAAILDTWGESYLRNDDATYGLAVNDLAYEIGFRDGDRILAFDGEPIDNVAALQADMVINKAREATVLRGGDTLLVSIDPAYLPASLKSRGMFEPGFPFVVENVSADSPNREVIGAGDAIVAVEGEPMTMVQQIRRTFGKHPGEALSVTLERDGARREVALQLDSAGMAGVMLDGDLSHFFTLTVREYNFFTAIPAGAAKLWKEIVSYVKQLGLIFSPKTKAYQSVGSFIAIGRIFPDTWDWYRFWTITALISIMLGVMNLLPIPALDGGHILFLIIEMITGRKPSDKFLERAETVGIILLMALMVLAFGNDIRSLFIK